MASEKVIAIAGAGVSGSLTAYHLRRNRVQARVVLLDPRESPGLGLAYSTPSYEHLLNVPAGKISALPEAPDHFLDWLHYNDSPDWTTEDFAPRALFGRYIQSLLRDTPGIEFEQESVHEAQFVDGRYTLRLSRGGTLIADALVVATGNFDPAPLRGVEDAAVASGAYCHSAWREETYAHLDADASVVLVGSGLTAVDVVLRLRELGHTGRITAISRHAVFPKRHAHYDPLPSPAIAGEPPRTTRALLRCMRAALAGNDWRAVVDSLRERTNELWLALPVAEQKRFRRHLQRRWEVVRHRMAPPIADRIEAELQTGTLVLQRGSLSAVLPGEHGALVRFRDAGIAKEIAAARVINCTGPSGDYRRVGSSLLNSLFAHGHATAGPLGTGLWTDAQGRMRDADGHFADALFHVGPGRQGTLLESIAVPELRCHALGTAQALVALLGCEQPPRS